MEKMLLEIEKILIAILPTYERHRTVGVGPHAERHRRRAPGHQIQRGKGKQHCYSNCIRNGSSLLKKYFLFFLNRIPFFRKPGTPFGKLGITSCKPGPPFGKPGIHFGRPARTDFSDIGRFWAGIQSLKSHTLMSLMGCPITFARITHTSYYNLSENNFGTPYR